MAKRNLPVHYVTEDYNIYNEYCGQNEKCLKIISINKYWYDYYGDFLEKYLTLLLKLKAVISCKENSYSKYSELFYNLDYVTYIAIGHGVCYFKDYLYGEKRIYGIKNNNKDIYNKTDYILADFIFKDLSFDDTYPIFQEMEKKNLSVHYVTEDKNIYNEYCYINEKCLKIISINRKSYINYGDFLENYLTLLLKLKAVISGKESSSSKYSELFYNLDYVTYIAIGHGVCYFKDFLYDENRIYGIKSNDKN